MKNKLRETRFFAKKPQMKLQKETGINASIISRIECEYVEPTQKQMRKLAKALGVKVSDLFPDETADEPKAPGK